jgi:hypothetical protein
MVFGIKLTGVRNDKNQSKVLKKQGARNESCPEDRNEQRQVFLKKNPEI